jgi:hypothetical protein
MADLYFSRDTKVYLEQGANVWELPVLDGFSFTQSTNSTEITLNEMSDSTGGSRRARKMFNDSYAPAEWSFSLYLRPIVGNPTTGEWEDTVANHHAIEEAIWANFIANNSWTPPSSGASSWDFGVTPTLTETTFDFDDSNVSELGTFSLYFALGDCGSSANNVYQISGCVTNSISIDFDIDGIATMTVSGFGSIIDDQATTTPTATVTEGISATNNFIRNRLTALTVIASDSATFPGAGGGVYNLTLTGGSISFENNITYLTPETLCTVNQPIGHVTGTRSIGGNFTSYLSNGSGEAADLFDELINATETVTNQFDLTFIIGGTGNVPRVEIHLPQAHLEVPSHSIEDVIAVDTNFSALPTTMDSTDEATIVYVGPPNA